MIFVFDLDGTICFKGKPIDEDICEALDYCRMKGHEVVFASARPIRDMLPVIPEKYHGYRMVGGNGAFTYENKRVQYRSFSEQDIVKLKNIIHTYKLTYLIDSDWDYSFTGDPNHPIYQNLDPLHTAKNQQLEQLSGISKAVLFTADERVKSELSQLSVKIFEHHAEEILDISPEGIDKAAGLKSLGILSNEYIAFGNDQNDLELFQNAKYSVCVGSHSVKEIANEQVLVEDVGRKIKELANVY